MREYEFHFLSEAVIKQVSDKTKTLLSGNKPPKDFLKELRDLLPVARNDLNSLRARVEGMYFVSEFLFQEVLEKGKKKVGESWDHNSVVSQAKLRPFSYYHYLTGSREPRVNVRTRDDYMNDPSTALMKLEDDIVSLGTLHRKLDTVG